MHVLGHLTIEEFLRDYWQKKPVLIRNAIPGFTPLLAADELAGLSLEGEIETRIIVEEGRTGPWEVHKGPFTEETYRDLPEDKWTLLVQGVDQWIPEAADLLEYFRFIPSWRIDDLMISYAVDGGSVGPHYDQYDVFLLQAEGQREWRIGQMCSEQSPIQKGPAVRILEEFEESDCWILNPGDMLYLPPKLAHYGRAVGECMTYSVGFRAPSAAQLLERAADVILPQLNDDIRYADPDLRVQKSSAEITADAINRLRTLLTEQLNSDAVMAEIIGQLMTEPKYPDDGPDMADSQESWEESWEETADWLPDAPLCRHEHARFAWHQDGETIRFWHQGEMTCLTPASQPLVALLSDQRHYDGQELINLCSHMDSRQLLLSLIAAGLLYTEEEYGDPDF